MLENAYLLTKIGTDTAENEQHFAEILPIGRRVADLQPRAPWLRRLAEADARGVGFGQSTSSCRAADDAVPKL